MIGAAIKAQPNENQSLPSQLSEHMIRSMTASGYQLSDLLPIWPQLASPEQHQKFLRRYVWGAWDILWPKYKSNQIWPQYLEALKLFGASLDELIGHSSMRRHILQLAKHRRVHELALMGFEGIHPYEESWAPVSVLFNSINQTVVSRIDRVPITKSAFYRSLAMPPNHWLLAQEDKRCFLPQIADPLQLIGIVRANGKWQYGVRVSALRPGPIRLFIEQAEQTAVHTARKCRPRAVYGHLVRMMKQNPRTPTKQMASLARALGIQVSERTLRRYRTHILLQQACNQPE